MSQIARKGTFDRMSLRVEPEASRFCRRIVPEDPTKLTYVSADGQLYEDETWKVKLLSASVPCLGCLQYRVHISYKGRNAYPGTKCYGRTCQLDTGKLSLGLTDYRRENGTVGSKIDVMTVSYNDLLSDDFGIWNGYIYQSPNDAHSADRDEDFSMAIVSDGKVTCEYDGKQVINPGFQDFAKILKAKESFYDVSGATWAVVIEYGKYDDVDTKLTLWTEEKDFNELYEVLEQYLREAELTRFDDLLEAVSR